MVKCYTHVSKLNLALVSPSRPQVLIAARSGMAVGRRTVWDSIFYSVTYVSIELEGSITVGQLYV